MEDDKLAAYYDELTRKGSGAARFKQGLGFSSSSSANDAVPARGSALPTTSTISSASFVSSFIRASSPSKTSQYEKQAQLLSIQNKLTKKPQSKPQNSTQRNRGRSPNPSQDSYSRKRRSHSRERRSRHRHRSRSRSKSRSRENNRERRKKERPPENGKKRGEVSNGGGGRLTLLN